MQMVSSVSDKLKVNGVTCDRFIPRRGLRQGDPLSPYMFILAVDVLCHMMRRGLDERRIKGIQLARTTPTLTHFVFCR